DDIKSLKEDDVRDQLKTDGFDGAVTMRLVDVDKDVSYTPGTFSTYPVYYRTFGGYYLRGWSYYSTPERYQTLRPIRSRQMSIHLSRINWFGPALPNQQIPAEWTDLLPTFQISFIKGWRKKGLSLNKEMQVCCCITYL